MKNFALVEFVQTRNNLEENFPDLFLWQKSFFFARFNVHFKISFLSVLHHYTKLIISCIKETLFESDDVWMTEYEITYFIDANKLASFIALSFSFSFSYARETYLRAYILLSMIRLTLNTLL